MGFQDLRQSWGIQGHGTAERSSPGLQAEHKAGMANSTGKGRKDALVVWAHGEGKGLDLMAREAPSSAFYLCCFLSFLWRTGLSSPTSPNTASEALEEENSLRVNWGILERLYREKKRKGKREKCPLGLGKQSQQPPCAHPQVMALPWLTQCSTSSKLQQLVS